MRQVAIGYFLLFIVCLSIIDARTIRKDANNITQLIGQIQGPPGGAARNLKNMILSINIIYNRTILHNSITPIHNSSFPLDYSIPLNEREITLEHIPYLQIMTIIWQPAFIHEETIKAPNKDIESLNFTMRSINFVIIRGEIIHDKHTKDRDLPGSHIKLELVEDKENRLVIDQIDFICTTKQYPCPFEYWLDTSHIKDKVAYRLEATLANHRLPSRKTIDQKHVNHLATTKSNSSTSFRINPTTNTEINNYMIVLVDVE